MKRTILLLFLLIQSISSFSQKLDFDETKNFIHLNTGKTLYFTDYFNKKTPFFGSPKLEIQGVEYPLKNILFYKNGEVFYASTSYIDGSCSEFATRIQKGKINLYKAIRTYYSAPAVNMNGGFNTGFGGGYSSKEVLFYNKGYFPLKKANYANLVQDLMDNQESMILLQTYKKARNNEVLLYAVGVTAMLGGMLTAFEKTGKTKESFNLNTGTYEEQDEYNIKPVNLSIGLAGFALNIINYVVHRNKKKYLKEAIFVYNN